MKLIVELKSVNEIKYFEKLNNVEYILLGVKYLSLNAAKSFNKEEIESILKKIKLKKALNAERIFHDQDLKYIDDNYDLNFFKQFDLIFYSDFGFYQKMITLGLKERLVFRAPTYLTNYQDLKLYDELNKYTVISSEISSLELKKIDEKIDFNYIIDIFGKNACFYSRRELLTNYFLYRNQNLDPTKKTYKIIEELRNEPQNIVQDETGTHIFEQNYSYLLEELQVLKHNIFGIIHTIFLTLDQIKVVVDSYNDYLNGNLTLDEFNANLINKKISLYKGAYDISSVLLKKEVTNE